MKICFSTLGCPNWLWQEITSAALDLGYQGIELRGLGQDLYVPQAKIFLPENVAKTADALQKQHLDIACVSSDCLLHDKEADVENRCPAYINLASSLSCPYVRVLADSWGTVGDPIDDAFVIHRLKALAPYAADKGVTLLVESNGAFADSARLKSLIEAVAHPAVQVLWDINHPIRNFGETIDSTWSNIGKFVRHVHIKDSILVDGKLQYKMLGYGDLPMIPMLKILHENGYQGYLSLEWTKRWNDELEDAGIVFAHYSYQIKKMLAQVEA